MSEWQDNGANDCRRRMAAFVKYVRTGEAKQTMFDTILRSVRK